MRSSVSSPLALASSSRPPSGVVTQTLVVLLLVLVAASASMGIPGGARQVQGASNDLGLQQLAQFAVEQHNKKEGSSLKLLKLVSASTQVVAGTLTKLKLWAAKSDGSSVAEYDAKVWEKPWEDFKEVSEFTVVGGTERALTETEANHLKEGKLLLESDSSSGSGGMESVSVEDPAVIQAAEQAVAGINRRSNSLVPFELKTVKAASLQHDGGRNGGMLFRLELELSRGSAVEVRTSDMEMSGGGEWVMH